MLDIKTDFSHKARWVLDGHKASSSAGHALAGAVSRESVRTAFAHAASNRLDIFTADTRSACLQAPLSEKRCIMCGPEFGLENIGERALIRRALHSGKAAGRDFRNRLRLHVSYLRFKPCLADPGVWIRPGKKWMALNVVRVHCYARTIS